MRRRALLGAVLAVAAFAWLLGRDEGGDVATFTREPLTAAELRWVRGYSRWAMELEAADLGTRTARSAFGDCGAVLRTTAGRPPSERLERVQAVVDDACVSLTSGVGEAAVRRGLARADESLSPLLLSASRPRATDSATVESRRSPLLGNVASEHARRDVEVVCWSDRDWRRFIREENAWSDSHDDPSVVDAMAYVDEGQIHMLLADCNLLGRLPDEAVADRTREGLIAAVYAVSVLSHEIQHFRLQDAGEAKVECAGAAALTRVARSLGLDARERGLLPDVYAESIRPDLPAAYREACRGV